MQKIVPHLWFDTEAKEAARFYVSVFPDSAVKSESTLHGTPSGSVDVLTINLSGNEFMLLSAGPYFKFTPAISFGVACASLEETDRVYAALLEGGMALMPLGEYPFSERFGWVQDRFGVSWQLSYVGAERAGREIRTALLFVGPQCGKAGEALRFYTDVFRDGRIDEILRYGPGEAPDSEGTIKQATFTLEGRPFSAMDSAYPHDFSFNEAVSLLVKCGTQAEIDYYWGRLSAFPEHERCGWLKDKFGVSWQIVPRAMDEMMRGKDGAKAQRFTDAMLKMKKLDLAVLEAAVR